MNGSASLFALIMFIGISFNLMLVSHLERARRIEVRDTNRRLEQVADRAAEVARQLAIYQARLSEEAHQVADDLQVSDDTVADRLRRANVSALQEFRGTHEAQRETATLADVSNLIATSTKEQLDEIHALILASVEPLEDSGEADSGND
jgi:hypothetical protein